MHEAKINCQNYSWKFFRRVTHCKCKLGAIIIPILHIKQLKPREIKKLAQGKIQTSNLTPHCLNFTSILHGLSSTLYEKWISSESHPDSHSGTETKETVQVLYLAHYWPQSKRTKRIISIIRSFSFCLASVTDFILVKSTFDVTPLYNDHQDSLYPEGTLETVQDTNKWTGSLSKELLLIKHWNPNSH